MSEQSNVYFVSLGCPKNLVDSQVMLGKLDQENYRVVSDPQEAKVIIVNTCSFIQAAKEESVDTILEMADYKEKGSCKILVVSGCLPQRYSDELQKEMPEIDLLIGTGQYHRITEALSKRNEELKFGSDLPPRAYVDQPAFIHSEKDSRMHTGVKFSGYLKLSEGCNRRCTFCIIPALRGNVRSRTMDSLVEEARGMAANGVRELNLVAQDLTHYGIETRYQENLPELLKRLCRIEDLEWIRLHYVYPDQFTGELVEVMASEEKIVNYLDMPIQHTNDRILGLMGRKLRKERLFELIATLREKIPSIVFRTSIIVGFPGETEEEFEELCRDLIDLKLDHVGVFSYSKEEGTKAAKLGEQIHPSTRRRRLKTLRNLIIESSKEKRESLMGSRHVLLVEGASDETDLLLQGRLSTQAQEIDGSVLINEVVEDVSLSPGDLVEVELSEMMTNDFLGKVTKVLKPYGKNVTLSH